MKKNFLSLLIFGTVGSTIAQQSVSTYEEAYRLQHLTQSEIKAKSEKDQLIQQLLENQPALLQHPSTETQYPSEKSSLMPPANDDCANATLITIGGGDVTYSNVGATTAGSDPLPATWSTCAGGPGNNVKHSVWFKFVVAGGPLNLTVSSQGASLNTNTTYEKAEYAVYSGSCGSFTQIGATRAGTYGNFTSKSINLTAVANGTYYIMTDPICSNTGTYRIRVDQTPGGAPTLWYAAGPIPSIAAGATITTGGQWGTYAATSELAPSCGGATSGFSDWYQFVYNSATMNHIGVLDHTLQNAFYIGLYSSAGTQILCNKWGQADYASYTWDLSAQEAIPMHMPNISLKELGLVNGATYYIRVANTSAAAYNVNATPNKRYSLRIGNFAPTGDSYIDNVTLSLTTQPMYIWLTNQTNRYAGHSMLTEPEKGSLGAWNIDNSLIYRFNSGMATSVDVGFQNLTYYNHVASTALGQVAVMTSPTVGTSMGSNMAFSGANFVLKGAKAQQVVAVNGLTPFTDYWIVVDGGGSYQGTKLTFDISVSTPQPLPVTLTEFSGQQHGTGNLLKWRTASEFNNGHFTLERTFDGKEFVTVAEVDSKGNSDNYYEVIDNYEYTGIAYYRLKQTDLDGKYSYSNLIDIQHGESMDAPAIVYPNPSSGASVNLFFKSGSESLTTISIYSVNGELIQERQMYSQKGSNNVNINTAEFATGLYFMTIVKDNTIEKVSFIKN